MSRSPLVRSALPPLLAALLAVGLVPPAGARAETAPPETDGLRNLVRYVACVAALATAPTPRMVISSLIGCGAMLRFDEPED